MSRVTELEKALTTLFRKGTEVGYTETEIDEFLENIDYHALLQAVWNKAETVYAYRADGKNALSLDYRSAELFKQRATLLYCRLLPPLLGVSVPSPQAISTSGSDRASRNPMICFAIFIFFRPFPVRGICRALFLLSFLFRQINAPAGFVTSIIALAMAQIKYN